MGQVSLNIFAKAPILGQTKTRLARSIGDRRALGWYRRMVWHCLQQAKSYPYGPVHLYAYPDLEHIFFQNCRDTFQIQLKQQQGADLGEKMHQAFEQELCQHRAAIIIGTDCPALDITYLDQARLALEQVDCVLGPSQDGGYVLIGLRRLHSKIFQEIQWGSERVITQTRQRLRDCQCSWTELPVLRDIDHFDDLKKFVDILRKIKLC